MQVSEIPWTKSNTLTNFAICSALNHNDLTIYCFSFMFILSIPKTSYKLSPETVIVFLFPTCSFCKYFCIMYRIFHFWLLGVFDSWYIDLAYKIVYRNWKRNVCNLVFKHPVALLYSEFRNVCINCISFHCCCMWHFNIRNDVTGLRYPSTGKVAGLLKGDEISLSLL
jgi:hypothetical protein